MITFKKDTELEIVDSFNEETDNIDESHKKTFKAGELIDAEIVSERGEYVDIYFGFTMLSRVLILYIIAPH